MFLENILQGKTRLRKVRISNEMLMMLASFKGMLKGKKKEGSGIHEMS